MFYMFLTIIWLIYHCSSFQDQHLTFFAPNLGPNLIHSFNVCEQDITITAITDIADTQIFLPPSQQRFPNLANKSLCYNVMTISLFVSSAQGGAHIAATRGGTKRALAWPGQLWCLLPSSEWGWPLRLAAVNHNPEPQHKSLLFELRGCRGSQ